MGKMIRKSPKIKLRKRDLLLKNPKRAESQKSISDLLLLWSQRKNQIKISRIPK